MEPWLRLHPDQITAQLIIEGFQMSFQLPKFSGSSCTFIKNFKSVDELSVIVRDKIGTELHEGRISGPFNAPPFDYFRLSPLGIVPKKDPWSYRLIHHLSYPRDHSLNDQIGDNLCSVSYTSLEKSIITLQKLGCAALIPAPSYSPG